MSIGQRIKTWRKSLGLTQDAFAQKAELSKATLTGYEIGQRSPGADALGALSRTGVDLNWLITGSGSMRIEGPLNQTIGDRLRLWRSVREWTQQQLATETGTHLCVVKKYEAGTNLPGSPFLIRLAGQGLNIHWLLTGDGEMEVRP